MDRRPEPVRGRLQIFQKMEKEPQARAGSPVLEYHAALVTGDLEHLKPLMDKFFQDANVVFEIKKDEMVWQVKSPATFGLSGTFALLKSCYFYGAANMSELIVAACRLLTRVLHLTCLKQRHRQAKLCVHDFSDSF